MFLRNWDKALAFAMTGQDYASNIFYKSQDGSEMNFGGGTPNTLLIGKNTDGASYASLHKVRTSYNSYGGVVFGTGTTPPTKDDYKLSGTLLTTFSYSAGVSYEYDDTGTTIRAIYTITNTGSNDITIGEIGLMSNMYDASSQVASRKGFIERTVLDTPVTIPAGGIGQVVYTIRINYPTA
jgi:hypothetical protein